MWKGGRTRHPENAQMTCPKCKYQNLHGANFCEKCGLDLKAAAKAAANPMPTPVPPYGYGSSYGSGYGSSGSYDSGPYGGSTSGYTPSPRPSAAPRPVPAPRAGQSAPPPQTQPPVPVAPPTRPPEPERPSRGGRISAPPSAPSVPAATPEPPRRPEPLPFGRLVASSGTEFPLRYDDNLIGRASPSEGISPMVDLTSADISGSVSRRHARIGKDDSSIYVEDLGSSNGTRLNGQALRAGMQAPLNDGDEVIFGSLVFVYHKIS